MHIIYLLEDKKTNIYGEAMVNPPKRAKIYLYEVFDSLKNVSGLCPDTT
jgi:hypothetical protein